MSGATLKYLTPLKNEPSHQVLYKIFYKYKLLPVTINVLTDLRTMNRLKWYIKILIR